MGYIRNAVLIQAPIQEVFRLTNDVRTWPELFTEYASSEVLEEAENYVMFRLTTHPDEQGIQWSWVSKRWTNVERHSTYSERDTSSGPFQQMAIRWWYNSISETSTVMTWEQEFTMKKEAPFSDEAVTQRLTRQTRIQQQAIKENIEKLCGTARYSDELYRGLIVGRYQAGSEEKIVDAFTRSDQTELPKLIGVASRNIWVQGDVYVHLVEARTPLPTVLKDYAQHPLFQEIKAEVDQYVTYPKDAPAARMIYQWRSDD